MRNPVGIWMAEEKINMTKALEKIAGRRRRMNVDRDIVCHRCGTECVLPAGARVDETVCIGCVQRLADRPRAHDRPAAAVCAVAEWSDKGAVGGPGYGIVACPHCGEECVVEVGAAARTGCGACLRPLGAGPLIRADVSASEPGVTERRGAAEEDDEPLPRYTLPAVYDAGTSISEATR